MCLVMLLAAACTSETDKSEQSEQSTTCDPIDPECTVTLIPANEPEVSWQNAQLPNSNLSSGSFKRFSEVCPDGSDTYEFILPDDETLTSVTETSVRFDVSPIGTLFLPYATQPVVNCDNQISLYSPSQDDFLTVDSSLAQARDDVSQELGATVDWDDNTYPNLFFLGEDSAATAFVADGRVGVASYDLATQETSVIYSQELTGATSVRSVSALSDGVHIFYDWPLYQHFDPATLTASHEISLPTEIDISGMSTIEGVPFSDLETGLNVSDPVVTGTDLWIALRASVRDSEEVANQYSPSILYHYDLNSGAQLGAYPLNMSVGIQEFMNEGGRTLTAIVNTPYLLAVGVTNPQIVDDTFTGTSTIKIFDQQTSEVVTEQSFDFVDVDSLDEYDGIRLSEDGWRLAVNGQFYEFDGSQYQPTNLSLDFADVEDYQYTWLEEEQQNLHNYSPTQLYPNYWPVVDRDDQILQTKALLNDTDSGDEIHVGHHRDYTVVDRNAGEAYHFDLPSSDPCYRFVSFVNGDDYSYSTSCLEEAAGTSWDGNYFQRPAAIYGSRVFVGYGPDVYAIELTKE